ncbi:hypothetical protein SAMN05192568_104337 [Methylobacterium pseudosasicola]|uniref:Integrase catalytic domain-containing protein n=1 Tax=Methylobacterium pseudosasicola TaxID=582667 RepID=A0A1I4SLZ0_9HYPH|nr:hypothetical protein SAMN05192568_104337 [Methylobacterium pseudosasicola]
MRLKELAAARVRYSYRRLHVLLRREGWKVKHERTYRIYRDEGLSIRSKLPKRKRAWRYRQGRPAIGGPNEVWAMDFMSDRLFDGRPFRILTVVQCHMREALPLTPKANCRAFQVTEALDALVRLRGRPKSLRVDNVLRSEEGRLARQQVSVREHAPAVCLSSTSIQAAPADPEELSAIANTGSSRCTRHRGPHRPQNEMSIQAGDPSIIYRVVVLTPSRLC